MPFGIKSIKENGNKIFQPSKKNRTLDVFPHVNDGTLVHFATVLCDQTVFLLYIYVSLL